MSTILKNPGVASPTTTSTTEKTIGTELYGLVWRLHFYAGVLIAPILIWASLTGIIFVFNPQIEAALYRNLLFVPAQETLRSYNEQLAAVLQEFPAAQIKQFAPSFEPGQTSAFTLTPVQAEHGSSGHQHGPSEDITVFVNPHNAAIVGGLAENDRFKTMVQNLHGNLRLGDNARPVMELGASWLLVLLLSGAFLWFPRKTAQLRSAFIPRFKGGSRQMWRDLHSILGVLTGVVILGLVLTGLTWSRFSGDLYRMTRDALGQNLAIFTPFPSAPSNGRAPISLNEVDAIARANSVTIDYTITMPSNSEGSYRVMTDDDSQPRQFRVMAIDQYDGSIIRNAGWSDAPFLTKLSLLGIPFHRGELFGLANQLICALAASAIIFSVLSGFVMWWKRRPAGKLGVPKRSRTAPPKLLIALFAVLSIALPTVGVSLIVVLLLDFLVVRRVPALRQAL
ncbi:MAG: PepSY domain-containing protein [Chloroflexales bacterium]|nr:PepSY domain-containing protein [Chloroflexales bacterium]